MARYKRREKKQRLENALERARKPGHKGKWIIEGGAKHVGRISSDNSRQQWEKLIVLKVKQRALNIEENLNLIWIHQHDW